jgi:hypothetical protein
MEKENEVQRVTSCMFFFHYFTLREGGEKGGG